MKNQIETFVHILAFLKRYGQKPSHHKQLKVLSFEKKTPFPNLQYFFFKSLENKYLSSLFFSYINLLRKNFAIQSIDKTTILKFLSQKTNNLTDWLPTPYEKRLLQKHKRRLKKKKILHFLFKTDFIFVSLKIEVEEFSKIIFPLISSIFFPDSLKKRIFNSQIMISLTNSISDIAFLLSLTFGKV